MTRRTYRVVWTRAAKRALDRLPEKIANAVIEFALSLLADNPERVGKPLRFELGGFHSANRGDFRILYRIDRRRRVVRIEAVGHRSDVYRRR
jgi:mRNA-degrading endonuclease RelE of RelBE toxin-antitoxin system